MYASNLYRLTVRVILAVALVLSALLPVAAKPDLDVLYIRRTPMYNRYQATEKWGADPNDAGNTQLYVTADEAKKQRWPQTGEKVTFTAVIKNMGDQPTGSFGYRWNFDGVQVATGTLPSIAPGGEVSTTYQWIWDSVWNDHNIMFFADPTNAISESLETNNYRMDRTNALSFCIPVWQSTYDWFKANIKTYNPNLASFEDYIQTQLGYINQMFQEAVWPLSPNGVLERVRLDWVEVVPDDTLDPGGNHLPNRDPHTNWDCVWGFAPGEYPRIFIDPAEPHHEFLTGPYIWILHEWGHQLGIPDLYQMDASNPISPELTYNCPRDCMMAGESFFYCDHTAYSFNRNLHQRRGFFGDYQYDMPTTCRIRVLDAYGNPMPNTSVDFYQTRDHTFYTPADFTGTTDSDGYFTLPNRNCYAWDPVTGSLAADHSVTTAMGHTLHDNPFAQINLCAAKNIFFCTVTSSGKTDYQFFDLLPFNNAYWAGYTDTFTYNLTTMHLPAGQTKPTNNDLYGIKMTSATHGYAAGLGGVILNWNGTTWSSMTSPVTASLRAVDAQSANGTACAVGDSGTVLVYSGGSWSKKTIATTRNLRACEVLSDTNLLVAGEAGDLYRSTDTGATWTKVGSITFKINSMSFSDSLKGIVTCDAGRVYYTTTGGSTWTAATSTGMTANVIDSSMCSATEAYAITDTARILKSSDGGKTWKQIGENWWANCMDVKAGGYGWGGGSLARGRALLFRVECGKSYREDVVADEGCTNIFGVSCVTGNDAWVVGGNGLILHLGNQYPTTAIADTTPPTMGLVTDCGDVSYGSANITANWSASDNESGVVEYKYAVGTTPTDPGSGYIVNWRSCQEAFTSINLSDSDASAGRTYYFYVKARNRSGLWSDVATSNGVAVFQPNANESKSLPSGTIVSLAGKICTANFGSYFYIEEPDRSSGIRVESADGPNAGTLVTVTGRIENVNGEAVLIEPVITPGESVDVKPLGVTNKLIGTEQVGLQPATWRSSQTGWTISHGLGNVALLVSTTGTVTYIDPAGLFAYFDDGSAVNDGNKLGPNGTSIKGMRVILGSTGDIRAKVPAVGAKMVVTGISATQTVGTKLAAAIRVRNQDDVRSLSGAIVSGSIKRPSTTTSKTIETPHPYQNSYYYSWTVTAPVGAPTMRLHFSQIEVHGADYVYYLAPGNPMYTIADASLMDFWTDWLPGNKVNLYLYTDSSAAYYGLKMDKYEVQGMPLSGATVTLMPGNLTASTDANGNFVFMDVPDGTYTVTPTMDGVAFTPLNQLITVREGQLLSSLDFSTN